MDTDMKVQTALSHTHKTDMKVEWRRKRALYNEEETHAPHAPRKKAPGTAGINPPSQVLNISPIIIGRNSFTSLTQALRYTYYANWIFKLGSVSCSSIILLYASTISAIVEFLCVSSNKLCS